MKTLRFVIAIGAGLAVVGVTGSGPNAGSGVNCPPLKGAEERPWMSLAERDGLSPGVSAALPELVEQVRQMFGSRYGGAWGEADGDSELLRFSLVDASVEDEAKISKAAGAIPELSSTDVDVVSVPRSEQELTALQHELALLTMKSRGQPADAFASVASVENRPDLGQIQITLSSPAPAIEATIAAAVPACSVFFTIDPISGVTAISRSDMPPYKGGKINRIPFPGGEMGNCLTGFVYERDGGTAKRVMTAGHCSQRDLDRKLVYDDTNLSVAVGETNEPNLFRQTSPAAGDAVLWRPTQGTSADIQRKIILDQADDPQVGDVIANTSIVGGMSVCLVRRVGWFCGSITRAYPFTLGVTYRDFLNHSTESKGLEDQACYSPEPTPGDSGGPVFQLMGSNPDVRAVGLTSTVLVNLDTGQAVGGCFTPARFAGNQIGSWHVFQVP
jgi:hypothetical protein